MKFCTRGTPTRVALETAVRDTRKWTATNLKLPVASPQKHVDDLPLRRGIVTDAHVYSEPTERVLDGDELEAKDRQATARMQAQRRLERQALQHQRDKFIRPWSVLEELSKSDQEAERIDARIAEKAHDLRDPLKEADRTIKGLREAIEAAKRIRAR